MLFYDVTTGCEGDGDGVKEAAIWSFMGTVLVTGIKGAGLAPTVMSVISGAAVAVIVTAELAAGAEDD